MNPCLAIHNFDLSDVDELFSVEDGILLDDVGHLFSQQTQRLDQDLDSHTGDLLAYESSDMGNNNVDYTQYLYQDGNFNFDIDSLFADKLLCSLDTSTHSDSNQYGSSVDATLMESLFEFDSSSKKNDTPSFGVTAKTEIVNCRESSTLVECTSSPHDVKNAHVNIEDGSNVGQKSNGGEYRDSDLSVPEKLSYSDHQYAMREKPKIQKQCNFKNRLKFRLPVELQIVSQSYTYHDVFSDKNFSKNIYERAIEGINIDSDETLRNTVLRDKKESIEQEGLLVSAIDLSPTYSNIRKYISDRVSPYINSILLYAANAPIVPGLSISEARDKCISNSIFFVKLSECCTKIIKNIEKIPHENFSHLVQDSFFLNSSSILFTTSLVKSDTSVALKKLLIDTVYNLPQSIASVIENLELTEIISGLFSFCHNAYVSKSLLGSVVGIYKSINKEIIKYKPLNNKFSDYKQLFDAAFEKVKKKAKMSIFLHEGILFSPNKSTVELITTHLVSDITEASYKMYLDLYDREKQEYKNIELTEVELTKDNAYNYCREDSSSSSDTNINLYWDPSSVMSFNIYKIALSTVAVDTGDFDNKFICKVQSLLSVKRYLSKTERILCPNLVTTYCRIKDYIVKKLNPLMNEIESTSRAKIEPRHGMYLDEFKSAYLSNSEFFEKLSNSCSNICKDLENEMSSTTNKSPENSLPCNIIQSYVNFTSSGLRISISNRVKNSLSDDILRILIDNIRSLPERIAATIKLLPKSHIIKEYFSLFHDMYVDNKSLLKVKSVFDTIQETIMNDRALIISSEEICERIRKHNSHKKHDPITTINKTKKDTLCSIIDYHPVSGNLSVHKYIKNLVKQSIYPKLKMTLGSNEPVIIRRNFWLIEDKMVIAEGDIKNNLLSKFESDLRLIILRSYRNLCTKKSKNK